MIKRWKVVVFFICDKQSFFLNFARVLLMEFFMICLPCKVVLIFKQQQTDSQLLVSFYCNSLYFFNRHKENTDVKRHVYIHTTYGYVMIVNWIVTPNVTRLIASSSIERYMSWRHHFQRIMLPVLWQRK